MRGLVTVGIPGPVRTANQPIVEINQPERYPRYQFKSFMNESTHPQSIFFFNLMQFILFYFISFLFFCKTLLNNRLTIPPLELVLSFGKSWIRQ